VLDARRALLPDPENDWFREISLPDMLLRLKQGAGRLVRSMTDRGVIAILSPRLLTKSYGREIIKALPPGRVVKNPVDALRYIADPKS
jgi:ATP-dependent DNA helicase DinG